MPGLSGSDTAYRWAIADEEPRGKTRADSTRAGFFLRNVVPVSFNGTKRLGVIQSSLRIDLNTGEEPHRCSFQFKGGSGYVPLAGHTVTVGHGSIAAPLFAGRLTKVVRRGQRIDDRRPTYDCQAAGWVFDLDLCRVVTGLSTRSLAPHSILPALLAATTPTAASLGFTASVDATLPVIEEFTARVRETVIESAARLARMVDGVLFVDHGKTITIVSSVSATAVATITNTSSHVFNLSYTPTDLSRVYTRALVFGAVSTSTNDVDTTFHYAMPLEPSSMVATDFSVLSYLLGGFEIRKDLDIIQGPDVNFNAGQVSTFLPASPFGNTLTVVSANNSVNAINPITWYGIGGQNIYVQSFIGVHSASGGSISYSYFVPSSQSGAFISYVPGGEPIAGRYNYKFNFGGGAVPTVKYLPAGTEVQIAQFSFSNNEGEVSSLYGAGDRLIVRQFEDRRLTPQGAFNVAEEALQRGQPQRWKEFSFSTRERVSIGEAVYVDISSFAESGAIPISGAFVAQDVTIAEFGSLTDTKGPVRHVRSGALRRPTMWQVLQGD